MDQAGMVDNASSTTIATAETQGLSNSCSGATEAIYLDGPDDLVVFPNPASDKLYINNLPKQTKNIEIINIEGKVVLSIDSVNTVDISALTSGIYTIKFSGVEFSQTRNFVVR